MKVSFRIFPLEITDAMLFLKSKSITVLKKGDSLRKKSKFCAKENIICFNDFYIFNNTIDITVIIEKLESILKILNENKIDGDKNLWVSILPENDQFGVDFPKELISFLSKNNISLTLSGVFL